MRTFVLKRILALLPVLLVVATVAFILVHISPGDPAAMILGPDANAADVARVRTQLGLDRPLPVQYGSWFLKVLQGDLGKSLFLDQPVVDAILDRAEPSALLTLLATLIAVGVGVPLGVMAAVRHNTWIDRLLMVVALLGLSVPNFWLGLNLIILFALKLKLLPAAGYAPMADGLLQTLKYLVLPATAIGVASVAQIARQTRSSMLDVLRQDFIRTANAKGLAGRTVIYRHALKNAMIPTLTVIGLSVAGLAGGAVVVELVFNLPGIGRLIVQSVMRRDYPVIQGGVMFVAFLYVLVNLAVDICYSFLDPRVRYS